MTITALQTQFQAPHKQTDLPVWMVFLQYSSFRSRKSRQKITTMELSSNRLFIGLGSCPNINVRSLLKSCIYNIICQDVNRDFKREFVPKDVCGLIASGMDTLLKASK